MKKLNILLGNNTLSLLAGSETWTLTLALALKKLGHDVACFSPELGVIAEELEKNGIHCYRDLTTAAIKPFSYVLEEEVNHDYDVIISNHNHIVQYLRSQYPKKPIISTIHGIIHKHENGEIAPEYPALDSGVNQFVAVSEEVAEKLKAEYNIEATIIRNFFDISKYKFDRAISPGTPKQFLINTNYNGGHDPEVEVIREVVKHYGAKLTAVGQNFSQSLNLSRALEDADVVIGMGRSVLEGVAAGRLGIVHGRWGTGGVVSEEKLDDLRRCNFSGRNSKGLATKEELIALIDKHYNDRTIEWGKQYMAMNHNAVLAAEAYVAIARELTGEAFTRQPSSANAGMKKIKFSHE